MSSSKPKFFHGWYIVGTGFLTNIASAFALASTLSIFLKPLTAELGISRGVFSLLRSGEGIIGALIAPFIGTLVDRHGGRGLIAIGTAIVAVGYLMLGHVETFTQFALVRLSFVTVGDAMMGSMVVNIVIAQWFLRRRVARWLSQAWGVGFAKVCMPIVAASLIVWFGWRQTWMVFGLVTLVLGVVPALLFMRRSPEEMGLLPDGIEQPILSDDTRLKQNKAATECNHKSRSGMDPWRSDADKYLLVTGHHFRYRECRCDRFELACLPVCHRSWPSAGGCRHRDERHRVHAAFSPLAWGLFAERVDVRIAAMLRFVIQGIGLGLAILTANLFASTPDFFIRHRSRRQHGSSGSLVGELFRPALSR